MQLEVQRLRFETPAQNSGNLTPQTRAGKVLKTPENQGS